MDRESVDEYNVCNLHSAQTIVEHIEFLRTERNIPMAIGLLTLELYLPLNDSLKGKRSILKPLIARLRRDYNVSICEADAQDTLSRAVLEVVCVSGNGALAHRQLQNVAQRVEGWRMDAQLIDVDGNVIEKDLKTPEKTETSAISQ